MTRCYQRRNYRSLTRCWVAVRDTGAICLLLVLGGGLAIHAQTTGKVYSPQRIREIGRHLELQLQSSDAPTDGIAEERMSGSTRVAMRSKSGRAEFHVSAEDVFFVLSGGATLISGGSIVNPKGEGEIRGTLIAGGTSTVIRQGDVVHIPAATPHQLLLKPRTSILYFVVKVPATNKP